MKYGRLRQNSISGLMALVVFGIFAVCILAVLLLGADTYENFRERDQQAYAERTCVQYLATRVRQAESETGIRVTSVGDSEALVLTETLEGETYETWIYCYDGWICEYFTEAGLEAPEPELGEPVLEAERLGISLEDGLLQIGAEAGGKELSLVLSLRGGIHSLKTEKEGVSL